MIQNKRTQVDNDKSRIKFFEAFDVILLPAFPIYLDLSLFKKRNLS